MEHLTNSQHRFGRAEQLLKYVLDHKASIGLLAPILYLLGYIGWSIHALIENIGPLPALDMQYFVTGIAITFIFSLSYAIYIILRQVPLRVETMIRATPNSAKYMRWLIRFVYLVSLVGILYVIATLYFVWDLFHTTPHFINFPAWFIFTRELVIPLLLLGGFAGWVLHIGLGFREAEKPIGVIFNLPLLLSMTSGIILLIITLSMFLQALPQTLGGFEPRCAYIYFKDGNDVASLPSQLFYRARSEPPYFTDMLDVLYSNDSIMLVRPTWNNDSKFTYEVRKELTASVVWCTDPPFLLRLLGNTLQIDH